MRGSACCWAVWVNGRHCCGICEANDEELFLMATSSRGIPSRLGICWLSSFLLLLLAYTGPAPAQPRCPSEHHFLHSNYPANAVRDWRESFFFQCTLGHVLLSWAPVLNVLQTLTSPSTASKAVRQQEAAMGVKGGLKWQLPRAPVSSHALSRTPKAGPWAHSGRVWFLSGAPGNLSVNVVVFIFYWNTPSL